jgi:hypothetical protein
MARRSSGGKDMVENFVEFVKDDKNNARIVAEAVNNMGNTGRDRQVIEAALDDAISRVRETVVRVHEEERSLPSYGRINQAPTNHNQATTSRYDQAPTTNQHHATTSTISYHAPTNHLAPKPPRRLPPIFLQPTTFFPSREVQQVPVTGNFVASEYRRGIASPLPPFRRVTTTFPQSSSAPIGNASTTRRPSTIQRGAPSRGQI